MSTNHLNNDVPMILTGESNESCNDCACPDTTYALKSDISTDAKYLLSPHVHLADLAKGYTLAFSPHAPAGPSVLNSTAVQHWQMFTSPRPLEQTLDYTLAEQGLIQIQGLDPQLQLSKPKTLTAWMHVTNACNLDCPYCYVRKSSARMSEEIGYKSIDKLFQTAQQHEFQRLKLKYAGGEATLHFKLIRLLHDYAHQKAKDTGLKLDEVVLSNGVRILPDDADWIADQAVKLMISLDGIGAGHNIQRPIKGGGDSFHLVEKTIDQILLARNIQPEISITITQRNAETVAEVVQWALERELSVSLNFYRQNILSASRTELALEEETIVQGILKAYKVFESILPTRPFFNGLLDRVQADSHTHTCGVGVSYLVITHEGKIAQCQMHLNEAANGNDHDDFLRLVASGPIHNLSVDQKEGCKNCTYRYRCSGGCPIETFRATGRWDVSSPNCGIYKRLLPEALKLEGLRLLKAQGLLPS